MPHTLKNPAGIVFTRWGNAIKTAVGKKNYASGQTAMIASTPFARIFMIGNPTAEKNFESEEIAVLLSFQCEYFASGQNAIEKVYEYDAIGHECMVAMGFARFYGCELIDDAESDIKRGISRYRMKYTGQLLN